MSIANKLIYLNGTKDKLKESINNIGGSITSETTFRNYATELDSIYSSLPKVAGTGSSLSLTPTLKGKLNYTEGKVLLGNTEQNSTNGYQLLNYTLQSAKTSNTTGTWNNNVYTISNVTITINDDKSITLNGTSNAQINFVLYDSGASTIDSGTYTLALKGREINKLGIYLNSGASDRITQIGATEATSVQYKQFTINETTTLFKCWIYCNTGTSFSNFKVYPMMKKHTNNTQDGQASPNPTYPQDIEVVTGEQEVEVVGTNLLEGIELGEISSTTGANGNATYAIRSTNYMPFDTTKYYYGSVNNNHFSSSVNLRFYNKNKEYIGYGSSSLEGKLGSEISITKTTSLADDTPKYFRFRVAISANVITSVDDNVQIAITNTYTYTPYTSDTYKVNLASKNMFDGQLELGSYDESTGAKVTNNAVYRSVNKIKVTPSTTYTFSINGVTQKYCVYFYDNSLNFLSCNISLTTGTFTTPNNCYYIAFRCFGADYTSDFANLKVQLELGSSATTYEAYWKYELCKIGTYQDSIYKTSGKNLFDKSDYTKGSYFNSSGELVSGANWGYAYIPCEPNTTYTASGMKNYSTPSFIEVDENKNFVANLFNKTGESSKTFTTTTGKYIGVSFVWNNSASNGGEIDTLMINKGSSALPYEPYGSGKWYKKGYIKKIELVSSGYSWTYSSGWSKTNTNVFFDNYQTNDAYYPDQVTKYWLSNYFGAYTRNELYMADSEGITFSGSKNITIRINKTTATDLTAFTTWLNTYKPLFYYVLATTTDTEITQTNLIEQLNNLEKAQSKNGQTNINISGNLPMILNIGAIKGE